MIQCPRCLLKVNEIVDVDPGLLAQIADVGEIMPPSQVCLPCMQDLRRLVSKAGKGGGVLLAQERAKEQHRNQIWKSRVQLIKRARMLMTGKNYSEAAVAYEKYIKVLELVFSVRKGESLTPEMFKENARTSELTVVASIYWDLLRIYDTSDKYTARQIVAAKQLAKFIPFTPIFPDIIKKAELFAKTAKHPQIIKQFMKDAASQRPRCFVATSAFGPLAPETRALRAFRDERLRKSQAGRRFIFAYYRISPSIARVLDRIPAAKPAVRAILRLFIRAIR